MATIDEARDRAALLVAGAEQRLDMIVTEEDSKIQLIVRFLTEVLGWNHSDISSERKHDNGFSDFLISHNGRPAFVVEAKRQGAISIATSAKARQLYKISGAALKPCLQGIEQAAGYCAPEGIQLAVLTDGVRRIFFKPFVAGESYKSKEAIVFPGLSAVLEAFPEFYELASKDGFKSALYKQIFDKVHQSSVLLAHPLSAAFGEADIHPEHKSQIAFDLDKVFNTFFSGLTGDNDPDLLIECFVETKESRIADFALEKLTSNVLGNIDPSERSVDASLRELIAETISDQQGDTVFIVGPSGAGKTTFLDRFFKKTLPRNIRERCVVVNINALDATGDFKAASGWVTNAVISALEKQLFARGFPEWDDLLGLYHLDYIRRSTGADAELYNHDKTAFKIKFGAYMEEQVEKDREGYLRRLLTNVVDSRKRLPIFVIDNTDEFSMDFKQSIFQYFQALRRHVIHCLLIFPVTDRSAWSFGKTEIFNIYSSLSYFLPTPSPREVFRKRVDYLKGKIAAKKSHKTSGSYGLGKAFKVSIENLEAFASAVEDIFVDQDYVSNRIGTLANYNIRKTLALSRRIITSAALDTEDLLKAYFVGQKSHLSPQKFMRALLVGDFNFFKKSDGHYVYPIFDVDQEVRQSPLLNLRVLTLLRSVHEGSASDDGRYLSIASVTQYFDSMGHTEAAVERCLAGLITAGLVEPYDPSAGSLAPTQRVAINYSGLTHLELAVFNVTFFEQLALTAVMTNGDVALEIRSIHSTSDPLPRRLRNVRERFASYLLAEDASFGTVPESSRFDAQRALSADIKKYTDGTSDAVLQQRDSVQQGALEGIIAERVNAIVDWFDVSKGYGSATIEDRNESAFLPASVLEGVGEVHDGDWLLCDLSRSAKGVAISRVYSTRHEAKDLEAVYDATVVRVFEDRFYGFVVVPSLKRDAFFHFSVVPKAMVPQLKVGKPIRAEINADPKGRGLQVRRVITIDGAPVVRSR